MIFHPDGDAICLGRFAARRFAGIERNEAPIRQPSRHPVGAIA